MKWFVLMSSALGVSFLGAARAHAAATQTTVPPGDRVAIVVLGYPSRRNGQPHPIQRWRAQLAVKSAESYDAELVVFTGGVDRSLRSEASVVAELAETMGLTSVIVALEERSTDTWENVAAAAELVGSADVVVIVSDPLHAARARLYWLKQRPADSDRVFITGCSGFWDHWWLKLPTAVDAALHAIVRFVRPL